MKIHLPLCAVLLLATCMAGRATEVLNNLFPDPTAGMQVLQRSLAPASWYATPITTDGTSYTLTEVTAEIEDFNPAGTLFMEIWSVSASAPSANIARLSLVDANFPKVFTGSVSLGANTSYFIVTGVDNGGGQWKEDINFGDPLGPYFNVQSGSWTLSTIGAASTQSFHSTDFGASWTPSGALAAPARMSISATAVPEPGTVALLGLGALALVGRALRRHR